MLTPTQMPFPESYIRTIQGKANCITMRVDELGRYEEGHIYEAVTYHFEHSLGVRVRINRISYYKTMAEAIERENTKLNSWDRPQLWILSEEVVGGPLEVIEFELVDASANITVCEGDQHG